MKVSVVVPVFNKAAYIERCVRSILAQTFGEFELILVDDGSTDESIEIASQVRDCRIKIIRQKNGGPGSARNSGIAIAKGDICAFLDADDEWLPCYLEESLELLEREDTLAAVVSGTIELPGGVSKAVFYGKRGISNQVIQMTPEMNPAQLVSMIAYMSPCSTLFRKSTLARWGCFYEGDKCRYAEDAFLMLKVILNERVMFSNKPRVKVHRDASELSNIRSGPRPLEPFLIYPDLVRSACPPHLSLQLERILAIRAFKTSCMLSFWGEWKQAKKLLQRFDHPKYWNLPLFVPAILLANPCGAMFARAIRYAQAIRQ